MSDLHSIIFLSVLISLRFSEAEDPEDGVPIIVEHPLDVIVSKGSPATLNCAAKPPGAQITWYKDGQPVTTNKDQVNSHRIILDTGALFLLKVSSGKNGRDGDSGSYHCVARNEHGEAQSREGTLKIAMLRDDFRTRPRTVQALSGDKAVLECSPPRGFPEPVVSWRKDDKELKLSEIPRMTLHPDGNLIIEPVEHSDSGTYQCVATNMVGERVSNPARLSVYEKPKFLQEPKDVTVDVGSSVLFDCRVSGEPQPQISWKKKNDQMPVARAYIAKDNRGLRIDRVQISDEGDYVCYARNPAGSIESSARLKVQAPPTFQTKPTDQVVAHGSTATFDCIPVGQPTPAYFWSKEGQQNLLFPGHVSADGRIKVSSSGTLTISDVRPQDEGAYVCAAMNSAGSSLSKALLKLSAKAVLIQPPPVIEYGHQNQTLMVGSSATLPCQASGRAPPRITWLLDSNLVDTTKDNRYSQHSSGSLHIADLRKSDTGVYTCRAKNDDGESTWTASLVVEDHNTKSVFSRMPDRDNFPSAPSQPVASNVSDTEVDLEWRPPERSGGSPITGYIIQFFSPEIGETWLNVPDYVSGPRYRVKNLRPSQTYVFIVRAENEKGIGPPSPISSVVSTMTRNAHLSPDDLENLNLEKATRRITSEQLIKLEEVKTINSTAVRLFWKRKKVEDMVEGYYIKWRGPPRSNINQWVNVSGAHVESYVVNGLMPFTNYEFFVIPYHKSIQGAPSNSMDALTAEAPPSLPPSDVHIRMLNLTTLRIGWRAPPADGMNGILKGFQIVILGKGTKFNRNITTNERAASVTLFHLSPGMTYKIRVAARTNAGIGVSHGTDTVTMNQETLDKHLSLHSEHESFLYSLSRQSWFALLVMLLVCVFLVLVAVFVFWYYKYGKIVKDRTFIKINDGSVHMTQNGVWDHNHYNTTGRMTLNNRCPASHQPYSVTPSQQDFFHASYDDYVTGTMNRPNSEHHYHYAQLSGGHGNTMSTFYGNHFQDDPSPYATTTLVMSNQQPAWLNDRMLRGPVLPSNPIPNGPPARYADHTAGRRSRGSRTSDHRQASHHSESPPHTDVSYVQFQSSDGTGESSNGRSKQGTMAGRRSPPKHTLMDFIPPPPTNPPPPADIPYEGSPRRHLPLALNLEDPYDSVSDGLAFADEMKVRPTSRNRTTGIRPQKGNRDDDSQRSSLMMDEEGVSSDADGETSDCETRKRKTVPRMGVSASALSQSSYDSGRSASRFKSIQRGKQDHV